MDLRFDRSLPGRQRKNQWRFHPAFDPLMDSSKPRKHSSPIALKRSFKKSILQCQFESRGDFTCMKKDWRSSLFSIYTIKTRRSILSLIPRTRDANNCVPVGRRDFYRRSLALTMPCKVLRSYFPFGFNGSLGKVRILRGTI